MMFGIVMSEFVVSHYDKAKICMRNDLNSKDKAYTSQQC